MEGRGDGGEGVKRGGEGEGKMGGGRERGEGGRDIEGGTNGELGKVVWETGLYPPAGYLDGVSSWQPWVSWVHHWGGGGGLH